MRSKVISGLVCGIVLATGSMSAGQEPAEIGIDQHLGERIPLETLSFFDEEGRPIMLKELFDRPIVLTLVYYRCPGICTPLLQEVAWAADHCDLDMGEDYRVVTISFDPRDTAELAKRKQAAMLGTLESKKVSPDGWRFLTGDAQNIKKITEAVGFGYAPDKNKIDFIHAATVVFLSRDGMIARYLNGIRFNPADLKMAVIDASEGRARSFMQKISRLCYSYDAAGHGYVLKINRIILGITLVFVLLFGLFVLRKKVSKRSGATSMTGSVS